MTRGEAAKILDSESCVHDVDRKGYIVEWEDGYRTWMPQNYFENEFLCNDTPLDRLRIECTEATERLGRLANAMRHDWSREKIGEEQYTLMQEQLNVMLEYVRVLNARMIAASERTR